MLSIVSPVVRLVVSRHASYPQVETGSPRAWRAAGARLRCGRCLRLCPVRVCVAWRRVLRARARGSTDRAAASQLRKLPPELPAVSAVGAFDTANAKRVYLERKKIPRREFGIQTNLRAPSPVTSLCSCRLVVRTCA